MTKLQLYPIAYVLPTLPNGPLIAGVIWPAAVTTTFVSDVQGPESAMKVCAPFWNEMKPTPPVA